MKSLITEVTSIALKYPIATKAMCRATIAIIAFTGIFTAATPASAIAIHGTLLVGDPGPDNSPANGNGTLEGVFNAAAHYWELAILDNVDVVIDYGWDINPTGFLGASFGDSVSGQIFINASPGIDWFVDATPEVNEEYSGPLERFDATLNGMTVNYGVGLTGGVGAADGFDLLTVLIHEIGHVLWGGGFVESVADAEDGDIDITAPRPIAGLEIPVTPGGVHLARPNGYTGLDPSLFPFADVRERRFISDADLLYVAQGGNWQQLDPDRFAVVPVPATYLLLICAGLAAGAAGRRPRRPAAKSLQAPA